MSRITPVAFPLLLLACGPKQAPEPAPDPEPVATAPEPAPEPEPEAYEPPPPAPNANLRVTITRADGSTRQGRVIRIERGEDWYAEDGWTDNPRNLRLRLSTGNDFAEKPWDEIRSLEIRYGARRDIDCVYDSQYSPWMYTCTLPTTPTVRTADGKAWESSSRHLWRFTFDDGETEKFYVFRLPARQQDERPVAFGDPSPENYDLYAELQERLTEQVRSAVTRVEIAAPE